MKLLFALSLLFIIDCSSQKGGIKNEKIKGHYQLYSLPDFDASNHLKLRENEKRLVVALTANHNGHYEGTSYTVKNKKQSVTLNIGGFERLSKYLTILENRFPGEVFKLDAGNFLSHKKDLKIFEDFFKQHNFAAINIGINDLTNINFEEPEKLVSFFKASNLPWINANIYQINSQSPVDWPNLERMRIIKINGLNIAIIGLVTPLIFKDLNIAQFRGLHFDLIEKNVLKYARYAKSLGADVVGLALSTKQECGKLRAQLKTLPINKVNFNPMDEYGCNDDGEIHQLIKRLPVNVIDFIVASGGETKIANKIGTLPVLRPLANGEAFSFMELAIDQKNKKVTNIVIHQPIMLCQQFIESSLDCFPEDESVNINKIISARFLGIEI